MNKGFLVILLSFFLQQAIFSQQNFYSYFQTENGQPFYIKYKAKLYSSSANGYLILPKLLNGENRIKVGFPKSQKPEINFIISINNNDAGYKIKSIGEDYSLFNIIDYSMIASTTETLPVAKTEPIKEPVPVVEKKVDEVIDTPKATEKKEVDQSKTTDTNQIISTKNVDTLIAKKSEPVVTESKPIVVPVEPKSNITEATEATIMKNIFLEKKEEGTEAIYVTGNEKKYDTIRVYIPVLKSQLSETKTKPENKVEEPPKIENKEIEVPKPPKETEKPVFLEIETKPITSGDTIKEKAIDTVKPEESIVLKKIVLVNSDCKKIASHSDFLSLRKKIAGEDDKEKMIQIAEKALKQKCYTTEQIKNIGVLFFNDNDRYDFFVVSYPFIYDTEEFKTLYKEFQSEEVRNRFKKLTNQN